jgi:hypothetical protein
MKKIILSLIAVFFALSINAQNQFLNPSFENWTGAKPNNWNTLTAPMIGNLSDVSKSTEANLGNAAVKIGAKPLPASIASMLGIAQMTVPGLLTNADIDLTGLMSAMSSGNLEFSEQLILDFFSNGVVLTEKPESVNGYFSWNPINVEKEYFSIITFVISNASGTRELIGMGNYGGQPNSLKATYTSFESPIMYFNEQILPTELITLALTGSSDSNATSFGYLLLDDMSITSQIGIKEISKSNNNLLIYPNPTTNGEFKLNTKSKVEVSVYNQLGQEVIAPLTYTPNQSLKVKERGVYFVRIKDNNGFKTQKLIVK